MDVLYLCTVAGLCWN